MKFLISNLRLLARRFKAVAFINIVGLAVAFAVTLVVAKQVWYDLTYDRGYGHSGEIFTLELDWGMGSGPKPATNRQLPRLWAERIPDIRAYALMGTRTGGSDIPFSRTDEGSGAAAIGTTLRQVTAGFLDVFTPAIVAGDASQTFLVEGRCIVSESVAARLFGGDDPLGRQITGPEGMTLTVDAVYHDFPKNSTLPSGVYTMLPEEESMFYSNSGYFLIDPADRDRVVELLNDPATKAAAGEQYGLQQYWLTAMSDYYLHGGADGQGGHARMMMWLMVIGLFVLVVAVINFINLSMAMAPARVRGINIHRILGIRPLSLRVGLALESVVLAAAAVVAGGVLVDRFATTTWTGFFSAPLDVFDGLGLGAVVALFFLAVAFGVGLYSARFASSFDVAIALKSSFAMSRRGSRLRGALIVVQFATAMFFICFASAAKIQYDYMSNYSVGYERENIVTFRAGSSEEVPSDALAAELRRNPNVVDVTSSFDMPGHVGSISGTKIKDKEVSYNDWTVAENFLDFFGIAATRGSLDAGFVIYNQKGRFASTVIVNREVLRKYDFTAGEMEAAGIGVADDVNFESLHNPIGPMAFTMIPEWKSAYPQIFVKITGADVAATMNYIADTWQTLSGAAQAPGVSFLDDELDRLYRRELNTSRLVGILGLVAVLIVIMGVYGLAAFEARYRTREIAIRKVNGATIGGVMMMLNRGMFSLAAVAFAVVVPVTVWIVGRWMGSFAFRAQVPWWLYPAAGMIVVLVSIATVSWQSWRAATANPVKSLNIE
jgi:putative ABC transport system permease protein